MPEVKDVLRVLRMIKEHQPIHIYGFAIYLGKPVYASTTAWRWIHYLEELGLIKKIREEENKRTGRKEYVLTERGERLLSILEEVWGGETLHNVSDIYDRRRERATGSSG